MADNSELMKIIHDAITETAKRPAGLRGPYVFDEADLQAMAAAIAARRAQPKQDAPSPDAVTELQAAYGLLWRMRTTDKAIHEARRSLMAAIGKDGQRAGLEWALRTFGPHPEPKLEDLP